MKANLRSARLCALALLATLAAAACDSFSLLDEFALPYRIAEGGPLELSYEGSGVVVGRNASVALDPRGGVPPYTYEIQASAVSPLTLGWDLGSVSNNVYSAGDAIGQVMIILTDSELRTDTVVVTVLPFAPQLNAAWDGASTNASITWTHANPSGIGEFRIERRASNEEEYVLLYSQSAPGSYSDSGLDRGLSYSYRIQARSGEYTSSWAEAEI